MAITYPQRKTIYDTLCVLKATGTVATTLMTGENPLGTDFTFDTGGGRTKGRVVYDISRMGSTTLASNLPSSKVTMRLQGGMDTAFASLADLHVLELGDATQISAEVDKGAGIYIAPFENDFGGQTYRYLRHRITIAGTISTITYTSWITK